MQQGLKLCQHSVQQIFLLVQKHFWHEFHVCVQFGALWVNFYFFVRKLYYALFQIEQFSQFNAVRQCSIGSNAQKVYTVQ